ncbi:MAG TPA: hypothetical protein VF157_00690 [Chloroflexota bacterium]
MSNLAGVGTPITYSEDNDIQAAIRSWRKAYLAKSHPPRDQAERTLLADWFGFRGRDEIMGIVGSAAYALSHFDLDIDWRVLLAEHIEEETGHGWNFIRFGDRLDPSKDHRLPDPEFERKYGLGSRSNHLAILRRDFLSYLIAGNLWVYGHVTASCRHPLIVDQEVLRWQEEQQGPGEQAHHYHALQKLHDYVWDQIERYGFEYVQKRVAEIDQEALNNNSRTIWDPPTRDFLVNHLECSLEMAPLFFEWRRYLYLNVLGWEPEPATVKDWPAGVPQALPVAA